MHITAQGPRLRNDLYCVVWTLNSTIPYHQLANDFCFWLLFNLLDFFRTIFQIRPVPYGPSKKKIYRLLVQDFSSGQVPFLSPCRMLEKLLRTVLECTAAVLDRFIWSSEWC